ncbi:PREDICTED: nucleic-acid-binding protein from mobile element jockey-like [Rhagoletis zephyria]|uniref:nucleic-acid-binding protein from mobile element jockey-like n=1 Tax=Rhagoletis zephyria TaxID=28612 RepID=UPI0008118594|nr:PREDICTED: nucleic-acid-binding protein from mobile element jockey-like [Rhagoletis zephyria]
MSLVDQVVLAQQQSTSLAISTVTTVSAALTTTTTTTNSAPAQAQQRSSAQVDLLNPTTRTLTQTGIDRYICTSQTKIKQQKIAKTKTTDINPLLGNKFAILDNECDKEPNEVSKAKPKPPPIYLREQNCSELVNKLTQLIGDNTFHVTSITKGNIKETKLQILTEENYRLVTKNLNDDKKNFYTYQLKSSKGLQVVIKGIESSVPIGDIAHALEKAGFAVKNVVNIINRAKIAQPMFKNNGPVQCTNCQEFGHTRTYYTLRPVCVACGDLHTSASCKAIKADVAVKKCSNCGGNHTTNYSGCPVYKELKSRMNQRNTAVRSSTTPTSSYTYQHLTPSTTTPGAFFANAQRVPNVSFADALKLQTQPSTAKSNSNQEIFANIQRNNTEQMLPNPPTCGIEGMILNLT